jgi:AFG3 family protein
MRLLELWHIKKITPKSRRLNIVLLFVVAVLLGVVASLKGNAQPRINFWRFSEQILKLHDVDHVVSYKSGGLFNVEVYLKIESLKKPEYTDAKKGVKEISFDGAGQLPQYIFTAATYEGLVKGIDAAETRFGYADADKIAVIIEQGHESLFSNWLMQCIIMIFLLILFVLCGYLGYKAGKKRIIGSVGGLLLGLVLGPVGLIIVYVTETKPLQKNGGTWV